MKRTGIIIMTAILLAGMAACKKLKHVKFEVPFTAELTVPATDMINVEHTVFSDTISTDVQRIMNDNKTSKEMVNSAKAEEVVLVIKSPDAQTFSYVKNIRIFLWAPGLPETWVAFKENVNEDTRELKLTVRDIELKEYFTSESFVVKATATHSKPITQDIKMDANIRIRFDANLLEAIK